jgi:3-oxoacyl-(acyl-carrier-protein) synthase
VDGNCGALDAVLAAETHLACGRADAFVVGGGEVLSEPLYLAFRKIDLLAEGDRKWAPGEAHSQGIRLSEGAVFLCMEPSALARQRGARVLSEVVGYGSAFEPPASEALLAHASEDALTRAVEQALADASLSLSDIDAVSSGVSGLPMFDLVEVASLRKLFGASIPVAMPKAMIGESFGAGGAFAMAQAVEWFSGAPISPLVSGSAPNALPPKSLRHVLVCTMGYYGNVSAVILRAPSH